MIQKGITGIGHGNLKNLKLKIKQFKKELYSDGKYKLLEIIEQQPSNNYLEICIIDGNKNIKILVNCQYGYSCCIDHKSKWMNLDFVEMKEDLKKRINPIFPYLDPAYLNLKVDSNDLQLLSNDELEQVKYWKSKTNGEIIFNGYD